MEKITYSLKQLSYDLDISVQDLRRYIHEGSLAATKVGRSYRVAESDLVDFLDTKPPERNYLCEHYNFCLDKAARANSVFSCIDCSKFTESRTTMGCDFAVGDSIYDAHLTMQ